MTARDTDVPPASPLPSEEATARAAALAHEVIAAADRMGRRAAARTVAVSRDGTAGLRRTVRAHPVAAVVVAGIAGALLGRWWRR